MHKTKTRLSEAIVEQLDKNYPGHALDVPQIYDMLEYPPNPTMGDFALPCFKLSRTLKSAPQQIAEKLKDGLSISEIREARAISGYLNIFINIDLLATDLLCRIFAEGERFGSPRRGEGKTIVLDYSSPNVAKPFHIGHLGTTIIGHSLKKLHEFAGYSCVGINHLGDWGTQFGKLIVAYRKWGSKEDVEQREIDALVALYVRFHTEAQNDPSLEEDARTEFAKLEQGDPENIALWRWFIEISIREYKKTYEHLGIEFDSYNGESFYIDKMSEQIQMLRDKNLLKIDDGASVVDLEPYGMPPCLILKKDGSTLYHTRDIAAAVYRKRTYDFEKCIYVTSAGQSLHFAQLFKVIELMGYDWSKDLVHVPYGTVSINGEKLATRTGNVILLKDLFAMAIDKVNDIISEKNPNLKGKEKVAEAVGVGAVVFHYLSNNRMRDINFVLEDALSFDGNTGPYAQYTYARTCSILEKASYAAGSPPEQIKLSAPEEGELALALARFPERVLSAIDDYEPSVITRYILELCSAFNRFYHNCQIITAESKESRQLRLSLVYATNTVLGTALELICMKKTEKI